MKYIPDDRTGFEWSPNVASAIVSIEHRSDDDWRIYRNRTPLAGDAIGPMRINDTNFERGRTVYIKKGQITVSGYHSVFWQDSIHRPDDVQTKSAGEFVDTVSDAIGKSNKQDVPVFTDNSQNLAAAGTVDDSEWWCIHTPGYLHHEHWVSELLLQINGRLNSLLVQNNFELVFWDADILLDGISHAGDLVVVRHIAGQPIVPISVISAELMIHVDFSNPQPTPGNGRQERNL